MMITFLRKKIGAILYSLAINPRTRNTYSQAGEDAILSFLFSSIKKSPVYLDIGTHCPDWGNNTYVFYTWGCRGVLVEANPALIPKILKIRPEDRVLSLGVSTTNQESANFFTFSESSLSTFNESEARYREANGARILDCIKVKLRSINDIIAENFTTYPDLLSIDIEGMDFEVLKGLNFGSFPIPVICAETCVYSETHIKAKDSRIETFLLSKGYFVYADTYINTIFVNRDWFHDI